MIEIYAGEKGKGKTKHLLKRVSDDLAKSQGCIIYIDKNNQHMYELDSHVRLIDMSEYEMESTDEFLGFISGMISQNNDIERIFLDSFLDIGFLDTHEGLMSVMDKLEEIADKFDTDFIVSISMNQSDLPDSLKPKVTMSL